MSGNEPPTITLHVGAQPVRLPAEQLAERLGGIVRWLEEWKGRAGGAELAVYGAFKVALNLGIPFVAAVLGAAPPELLPPLPKRPRHSDPVVYLLSYLASALPFALARGEWRVLVDEAGAVPRADWLHWHESAGAPAQEVA